MSQKANRKMMNEAKNALFNSKIKKTPKPTRQEDREALSRKLASDVEAFKASGGRVKHIPSKQVPPKKRPAMQHYGNGGFYQE